MQEYKSTLTGKRQITIPIEVCRLLRLEKGNQVLFKIDEDKIIFDVEREYIDCFICDAASNIGEHECFICNGAGRLNKSLVADKSRFIGELIINSIKDGVSIFIKNQEISTNNNSDCKDLSLIELKSDKYSEKVLDIIQNRIQKYIMEDGYD